VDERKRSYYPAATSLGRQAIAELLAGDPQRAADNARIAVAMSHRPGPLWAGALVYALLGRPTEAIALRDAFRNESPQDLLVEKLWMPILQGSIQLGRGDPQGAIDVLEPGVMYERGSYWPRYLRGLAHLRMGHGFQAALEFSRIVDQPGLGATDLLYVVAQRQLARATAMSGGGAVLGQLYGKFFKAWQHADRDLPLVSETREEYRDLRRSVSLPPLPEGLWRTP
jgi:hypothetical protein